MIGRDGIESARAQFDAETTEHRMTVVLDEGLHRHLHFARPGTGMWSWSVITWPGHLAIAGDIGDGWMFAREDDMLQWFGRNGHQSGINPGYWSEKMPEHHRNAARHFSAARFEQHMRTAVAELDVNEATRLDVLGALEDDVFLGYDDLSWTAAALEGISDLVPFYATEPTDAD
ncbi:hypothetical protein [Microbacterium sp. VKM Ac-2923]|uniref:hypothetical protein n=1 Tax=Microbacterium sp. VKM Ac-2923 TaxID=2929476 RepID=UPI001FB32B77|nr:hypothetical protein [Microbacterium sp. VKM Ac-2923]MCJ1709265.1 hypothetical protein [Microbacterium sp. VKM Ac-2923]